MKKLFVFLFFLGASVLSHAAHNNSLTWTQTTDPVALNCVFKSATKGGENAANPLFCSTTPITNYGDAAVNPGDTNYYAVDAVSSAGKASSMSNEVGPLVTPFLPPTNLQGTPN
jgi:fibronectin type 3 domain-containing protein